MNSKHFAQLKTIQLPVISVKRILGFEVTLGGLVSLTIGVHFGSVQLVNDHMRSLSRHFSDFYGVCVLLYHDQCYSPTQATII